jgi:hypothetical protein
VVGRDHRIEFAAHSSYENRIGGERPGDTAAACGGRQHLIVFAAEPSAVAGVGI